MLNPKHVTNNVYKQVTLEVKKSSQPSVHKIEKKFVEEAAESFRTITFSALLSGSKTF